MGTILVIILVIIGLILMGVLGFLFGLRTGIIEGMRVTEITMFKASENLGFKSKLRKEIGNL